MSDYDIQLDAKSPDGTVIDVARGGRRARAVDQPDPDQIDDAVVRLGIIGATSTGTNTTTRTSSSSCSRAGC